ncbi:MAG: P-II family nitrogen regulator [Pseudomonadota bacterium]
MSHKAKKIVVITEKLIVDQVKRFIEENGASGYTVMTAGGKGSRGARSEGRNAVTDSYVNVKIEIITTDEDVARNIADKVTEKFFDNYSGITYIEDVEIIRPQKFLKDE